MKATIKKLVSAAVVAGSVFAGGFSYAGSEAADLAELRKAVHVCQQKVQRLESVCPNPALQKLPEASEQLKRWDAYPAYEIYDSQVSYGSAYWGFLRDN